MRYRQPDKKRAQSLLIAAEKEIEFTKTLSVNELSASTIIRNVYQSYLMVGEALLIAAGMEPEDHAETIGEVIKLPAKTKRPLGVLDNLRKVRNNINYDGYLPSVAEAQKAFSLTEDFPAVLAEAKLKIK